MKIIVTQLIINNFKGIKSLNIDFKSDMTNIYGANESGKTTLTDAWHWLLTNKNSIDEKDFNIKNTKDLNLNRADHEVSAHLLVDGRSIELKKVFREKWTKKRGEQQHEFTGHETLYFFNEVPMKQEEYQNKIKDLLPENSLKILTNPLYFNTIKWQERRTVLLALAGNISNGDVLDKIARLDNKQEVMNLTLILNSGKSVTEYKAEIGNKKKRIKDQLVNIPSRIDEVKRSMPQPVNFAEVESQIETKNILMSGVEASIADRNIHYQNEFSRIQQQQTAIHELKEKKSTLYYEIKATIDKQASEVNLKSSQLSNAASNLQLDINTKNNQLNTAEKRITVLNEQMTVLRAQWDKKNDSELKFDDHLFECPTCKRALDAADISTKKDELQDNFMAEKKAALAEITQKGVGMKNEIVLLEAGIKQTREDITILIDKLTVTQKEFDDLKGYTINASAKLDEALANNDEYINIGSKISNLTSQLGEAKPIDVSDLKTQKIAITQEIDDLRRQLNSQDLIERLTARVTELETEERGLAQQLADLERSEFLIEDFTRSKMDIMEARINGKFKYVSFKLFDRQINGGETETCETMYKNVPFGDLNTAGRIWAGIDIINTLSVHYNVAAPIFLDNRESCTNIPDTESQIINLIVSASDKSLRVEQGYAALSA